MIPPFILSISFDFDYLPLLIVVTIAWLVPMSMTLFKIKRIPTVVIEIIAGYVVGLIFLQSFSDESFRILEFLALTGFIFLMFLSGLEIDVDQIIASLPRKRLTVTGFLKNPLLVGLAFFILTLALSYLGAFLLSNVVAIEYIGYFALVMVTTSVGIIFPVLKNRGETNTRFGQMIILAAAVADIFSILLFTFSAFILKNGFQPELFLVIGLFFIVYLFYLIGSRLKLTVFKKISFQLAHAASQISIRGTLVLILIFVVLSQILGKEVILLGAFLSGLLLSFFLHKGKKFKDPETLI